MYPEAGGGGGGGAEGDSATVEVSAEGGGGCQMAEFRAAGPKNGPVKFLAAKEVSGLESGRIS
jgi:hypothetical protein